MIKKIITEEYLREKVSDFWFSDLTNEDIVPYFFISNDVWFDDGFEGLCLPETKATFYNYVQQVLDIILSFAYKEEESKCYIGPFHNVDNYERWTNKEEFDCFNELKNHIANNDYFEINVAENKELLGLLIENNFRCLTKISICFPKNNILLRPTHHMEVIVYSQQKNQTMNSLLDIVYLKKWKLIDKA